MNGIAPHARAALLATVALLAGSCRSVASAPASSRAPLAAQLDTWRDLRLYEGECAFILASSEAAARQAHEVARVSFQVFADELGRRPLRGLLIACSKDDRLLIDAPEEWIEVIPRWHAAATGREVPPPRSRSRHGDPDDVPPELAARLLTGGIPVHEPGLDLPAALRERIAYAVLLPTDDCLAATCSAITDLALEREGVSWIQLKLVEALAGHPADLMTRELRAMSIATLLDVVSASEGLDAASADAVLARGVASGVLPERARRRAARDDDRRRGDEPGPATGAGRP